MHRIARLVLHRTRLVLVLGGVAVLLAAVLGSGAFGVLKTGGFENPGAESSRAQALLTERFGVEPANLLLLVTADDGATVTDAAVAEAGRAVTSELGEQPGVEILGSFWDASGPAAAGLIGRDGTRALVVAHLTGDEDARISTAERLQPVFTRDLGPATVATGGLEQANLDIGNQVGQDLLMAEIVAVPLTIVLLLVVFGSVVAGLLPLLVGGTAIAATFAALFVLGSITDVSVFAVNLAIGLGVGLGVDYALLIVSRFREELAHGHTTADAVRTTLTTAGRTILFSAATVAVSLATMLVFPLYFLRSFAYSGIVVVAAATVAALVVLPALLAVLGTRVDGWTLPWLRDRGHSGTRTSGGWARLATVVMRRPVLTGLPVLLVLPVGAVPLAGVEFGSPDDRTLQSDVQARQVGDALRADFDDPAASALDVVLPDTAPSDTAPDDAAPDDAAADVTTYALELSALPGVARVGAVTGVYADGARVAPAEAAAGSAGADTDGQWLSVVPAVDPSSAAARDLVAEIRATAAPGPMLVTGPSAGLVDSLAAIGDRLWLAGTLIAVAMFTILFLFTGSVVLPIKALLLNLLTIGGVLGVMVWIFQEGHLSGLLGFTPGPIDASMPILLFCVAFGLSMDYELFLLGRIKEEHDAGADTRTAVAHGLERTGRIVTLAAALLAITFFAFGTSGVSFIQFFGIGTGLAIVVDATLVRGILVPAVMRLFGEFNWWAPAPLRRLHDRIGLTDSPTGSPRELTPSSA